MEKASILTLAHILLLGSHQLRQELGISLISSKGLCRGWGRKGTMDTQVARSCKSNLRRIELALLDRDNTLC